MMTHRFGIILTLTLAACARAAPERQEGRARAGGRSRDASLVVVDSVQFASELDAGFLYRFAVRVGSVEHVVPGVLARDWPTLVGGTLVTGIAHDTSGAVSIGFRYFVSSRRLDTVPIPSDLMFGLTDVAFSPDGRHVAYVAFPGDETGIGTVRKWPSGELVLQTPKVPVAASDVLMGAAVWRGAEEFEIVITPADSQGSAWIRFRGHLRRGIVGQDTIPATQPP